ncbi:MAG: PRTRC system protein D [Pseudomonadales bacterium]
MKPNMTIRAIDIGYGNTKFVTSALGTNIECDLLPSRAPLHARSRMGGDGAISGRRNILIDVNGRTYEVGPDTELFKGPPILHDDYTDTDEYLALYRAALARMRAPLINALVTGLPVSQLDKKKAGLQRRLSGKHLVSGGRYVNVETVHVFAQPLGGLVDHCLLQHGGWNKELDESVNLLVDPGYYTLDWVVAQGLTEVPELSGSFPAGMSNLVYSVGERIAEATGKPFSQHSRLDQALRRGSLQLRGQTIDLSNYTNDLGYLWHDALTTMKNNVGTDFDRVYLVGGGAQFLQNELQAVFPDHPISVASNSVFANVRGFQAIGHFFLRHANVA